MNIQSLAEKISGVLLTLASIFIFLYETIAIIFSLEMIFDPYRLVGIHGIDQYTDFWMKVRSFAYLLLSVGVAVMWLIIRWILKRAGVRKRIQMQCVIFAAVFTLLSVGMNQYYKYTEKLDELHNEDYTITFHYGDVADQYLNSEPLNESFGTKILSYEHRTWFQKLYKSRVTFYALSGDARAAKFDFLKDENAYVPEWMYTGWNWILRIRRAWSQWLVWFFVLAAWGTGWAFETSGEPYEDIEE